MNGCVAVLSIDTGKCLDVEVLGKVCLTCQRHETINDLQAEQEWQVNHAPNCKAHFTGSALSMETEGVKRIFERSKEKHKLRYTEYYGNGDSKGFNGVENTYIDKGLKVVKKECVGHVQKRVGTALRKLKKEKKGMGGKGKLNDRMIDRLQNFFRIAIRNNVGSLSDMKRAIYACLRDPEVVKSVISGNIAVASHWFDDNKLKLNPEKCKCIILPKSYPSDFSFSINGVQVPIVDHLELLVVTIDNSLNFSEHIGKITKKVGKQLDVLSRLKNMLSIPSKMCLYNSYVMFYYTYCSAIWHNCIESDNQKLESLNSTALRCVYNKRAPPYGNDDHGSTLSNHRLQDNAILIFKAVNGMLPEYISDLFVVRNNVKDLRGTNNSSFHFRNVQTFA